MSSDSPSGTDALRSLDPASDAPTVFAPSPDRVEEQGRADGPDAPAAYESFLVQSVAEARIQNELDTLADRIEQVEATIEQVEAARRDLAALKTGLSDLQDEREETAAQLDDVETSIEAVEQEQAATQEHGSTLYALLYTVAGGFFIAGDVIMSREIVANALKLRGDAEQWIFAVGLAMLAVLLKPAYDRLVEREYWAGNSQAFAGVISVCALGALGTLWVLGAFRSTAFATNSRIQQLTQKLTEASDPAAIQQIQSQISTLQQNLIEGPLTYWAFALSGVLFAVAGAVCLGIGLRHVRKAYHLRFRLYRTHRRLQSRRTALTETLRSLKADIPARRAEMKRKQQLLADTASLDTLRERRDRLRSQRRTLRNKRAEVHSQRLQALYRHGSDAASAVETPDASPLGDGAPSLTAASASDGRTEEQARSDQKDGALGTTFPDFLWPFS
jgi:uncharacterized membrane protein